MTPGGTDQQTLDIASGQADTYTIDSTSDRLLATRLAPRSRLFDAMGNTTQISTPAGTAEFAYGRQSALRWGFRVPWR